MLAYVFGPSWWGRRGGTAPVMAAWVWWRLFTSWWIGKQKARQELGASYDLKSLISGVLFLPARICPLKVPYLPKQCYQLEATCWSHELMEDISDSNQNIKYVCWASGPPGLCGHVLFCKVLGPNSMWTEGASLLQGRLWSSPTWAGLLVPQQPLWCGSPLQDLSHKPKQLWQPNSSSFGLCVYTVHNLDNKYSMNAWADEHVNEYGWTFWVREQSSSRVRRETHLGVSDFSRPSGKRQGRFCSAAAVRHSYLGCPQKLGLGLSLTVS